jgi:hypothetical protein
MKTTIEVSDPIFEQTNGLAAETWVSFQFLVEEGLRRVIERRNKAPARRFQLRDGSFKGKAGLQPDVWWSDLRGLAHDDRPPRRSK